MSSILLDVKHKIGPSADYEYFETDVIDAINTAFATLNQVGAPEFAITDDQAQWEDYSNSVTLLGFVRTFICDTVRLIFDPPNSSFVITNIKERLDDLLFRIHVEVDNQKIMEEAND